MPRRRPTQADVARLAGVSRSVVSLVLNQRDGRVPISDETRQRVLAAMKEVGYVPNPMAQMLAGGSNRLVGVFTYEPVFPYEREDFYHPFLLGIEREATRQDYNVLLFTRNRGAERRIFGSGGNALGIADGAILLGPRPDRSDLRRLSEEGYPFVYIGRREVPGYQINWVVSDYAAGSALAVRHLLELGHRRLAFIGFSPQSESSCDRLAGCQEAVSEVPGAELAVWPETVDMDHEQLGGYLRSSRPTALLCADEHILRTALSQLRDDLRVPADISVVCLTDCEASPDLGLHVTQLRLNRQRVGQDAMRVLADLLNGRRGGVQQILVPCEYVAGATVAPLACLQC